MISLKTRDIIKSSARIRSIAASLTAILALASIGADAKPTVPALIKSLENKQYSARPAAAFALGRIGAKEAVPALKNSLNTPDSPFLRLASIWALLQIEPDNKEYEATALPLLTTALDGDRADIRLEAAKALARMGVRAKSAAPALRSRLADKDPNVRREALVALAEIGPDSHPAVTEIIKIFDENDSNLRRTACYALGRIGAASKPAIPRLQRALLSRDAYENTVAAWALVHIAPDAETVKVAIPLLAAALHGAANPKIRIEMAETLGNIGKGSPGATEALQLALKDSDDSVKKAAETALGKLK